MNSLNNQPFTRRWSRDHLRTLKLATFAPKMVNLSAPWPSSSKYLLILDNLSLLSPKMVITEFLAIFAIARRRW